MPQRILIVRLSAIGDCILSVPVLNALRRNFPQAQIGWVIERTPAQLIHGHSALNELFVVTKQTFKSPSGTLGIRRKLRSWNPDLTIDLQGLTKSSMLAWLSGAKDRVGFRRDAFDGREMSTWLNNHLYRPQADHIVERGLELLEAVGINDKKVEFGLPEKESDADFADRTIRENQLEGRFAIINVGAGWPSKLWPSDRYASIARHVDKQWGLQSLVVWSGDEERVIAEKVANASVGSSMVAPATTLTQLGSVIRRASLFVGSDTGPMHLSVAVGTPTVGMIGPMPIERVAPHGPNNIGVQNLRLSRGKESDRKTDCGPMLSITVEQVAKACDQLMNRTILANERAA